MTYAGRIDDENLNDKNLGSEGNISGSEKLVSEPTTPEGALDFMWQTFGNLNEWVRFSDTKAAAVLATDGVIAGALITLLTGSHTGLFKHTLAIIWVAIILMAAFYSAIYALLSLMPQLKLPRKKESSLDAVPSEEASSLIFFMDIERTFPTNSVFHSTINAALTDTDNAVSQISHQVWANSKVATVKYSRVTNALYGLFAVTVIGFVGVIIIAMTYLWY